MTQKYKMSAQGINKSSFFRDVKGEFSMRLSSTVSVQVFQSPATFN